MSQGFRGTQCCLVNALGSFGSCARTNGAGPGHQGLPAVPAQPTLPAGSAIGAMHTSDKLANVCEVILPSCTFLVATLVPPNKSQLLPLVSIFCILENAAQRHDGNPALLFSGPLTSLILASHPC